MPIVPATYDEDVLIDSTKIDNTGEYLEHLEIYINVIPSGYSNQTEVPGHFDPFESDKFHVAVFNKL